MTPSVLTLTGADDRVDIDQIYRFDKRYEDSIALEWGILFLPERTGYPRYPGAHWRLRFVQMCQQEKIANAIHLCGSAISEFAATSDVDLGQINLKQFGRVQLNARPSELPPELREKLRESILRRTDLTIILQVNEHSQAFAEDVVGNGMPHVHFLYDASRGKGISPSEWPDRHPRQFCGYAGGLTAENAREHLPKIRSKTVGVPYWVDAESGLRNSLDEFSLPRALQYVESVEAACTDLPAAFA